MKPILKAKFRKPVSHSPCSFTRYRWDSITRRRRGGDLEHHLGAEMLLATRVARGQRWVGPETLP
jgi:hypothetical protein